MARENESRFVSQIVTWVIVACCVTTTAILVLQQVRGHAAPSEKTSEQLVPDWPLVQRAGRSLSLANAPVRVVEFGDFQCPACAAFHVSLAEFRREHPDVGVRFAHFPLSYHKEALPAAHAAECAFVQGRFGEMHDALYRVQDSLGMIEWKEFARRAGVRDLSEFSRCLGDSTIAKRVADEASLAKTLGLPGTPGLVVDGRVLREIPTAHRLAELLDLK